MQDQQNVSPIATDPEERHHRQTLLTQRLLVFLALSSILFLAFVNLDVEKYVLLGRGLPIVGLIITVMGVVHLWFVKRDLDRVYPLPTGLRQFITGRYGSIYLCLAFCAIWGLSIAQIFG